ncbi:glucose dehydrogenase [Duganella sp. FT80W]|uniref:Glucose dehydrogenase n=1 Tax=Duganella guangzhouensis TaxID=2666084 RepID=A0A6I2L571_9BURK|nr:PQQ-dependent sugar dehydrogenase [Duganella guangzhouensis]MRW92930.1 glucose dehydrogenase [Duganella guangzhouensis]
MSRRWLGWSLLAAWLQAQAADTCGGFPRLDVSTPGGFCAAVLADGFKFPRGIQPLPNGDLVVVDMRNWEPNRGSVWLLKAAAGNYERIRLLSGLDRPNGIVQGPDGLLYLGLVGRVIRFDPRHPGAVEDVIGGDSGVARLPGLGRHLLTTMRFDAQGNLFVNVGSASDHCEDQDGKAPPPSQRCAEAEGPQALGVIRKYTMAQGKVVSWENYATGLRNSQALAIHPVTGAMWEADNARDFIQAAMPGLANDNDLPHDELNLIRRGANYGWPYCYDDNRASPEYPQADCKPYAAPARLLPAHAAPLGMTFYTGSAYPAAYKNSLIIGFHGYRDHGHRLVAILPDRNGAPLGKMYELIGDWGPKHKQPMGAPVDIKQGPDGNIYLVEDRTGRVVRLQIK